MRNWLIAIGIAVTAVVLACCVPASRRSETDPRKHRFGAIRSPLIEPPTYRILFLLVVVGVLLISVLPEGAFVLPALDAVGLDIVTILVALELRHYILFLARLVGVPTSVNGVRRGLAPLVSRCLAIMIAPTNPKIWPYTCMWILIAFRIVMGSMKVPPQAQG
jgi:hypothetical protein